MKPQWDAQCERSTPRMLRLGLWLALHLGRRLSRLLLYPIVAYFLITGGEMGCASHRFLRHALGRAPTWIDRVRHWYTYAAVVLDRIFLLGGHSACVVAEIEQEDLVLEAARQHRGALLLVSHFGSFEVMRVIGQRQRRLPIRIVVDRQQGAMLTQLLEALDPVLAAGVIDASQHGPALALSLKQALDQGDLIGMMGDRALAGPRTAPVRFMNRPARLPESPWILASVLQVPVILAFGIYDGDNRYRIRFETLAERVVLPRASRAAAIQSYAQSYADRLEAQVRTAPYNWFNFFDFWTDEAPADQPSRTGFDTGIGRVGANGHAVLAVSPAIPSPIHWVAGRAGRDPPHLSAVATIGGLQPVLRSRTALKSQPNLGGNRQMI